LDNQVGKLSAFIETWFAGYDRVHLVSTFADAFDVVGIMTRNRPGRAPPLAMAS
jgi:hypothetical protein